MCVGLLAGGGCRGARLVGGFLPTHGFTAILIALVANLSVVGIAAVSLFFGALAAAALYLPIMAGLPSAAIDIINAAIALFITARTWPGLAGFFRGFAPCMIRAAPVNASTFLAFELAMRALGRD